MTSKLLNLKQEYVEVFPFDEVSNLRKKYSQLKSENKELKEKMNSIEKNLIKANEKFLTDLEEKIKQLENELKTKSVQLEKEQKKSKQLSDDLKLKEKKLKSLNEEFIKQKSELSKKINELNQKLNIKKTNNKNNLINKYESLNSIDYSELCDSLSVDSDEYLPLKKTRSFNSDSIENTSSKRSLLKTNNNNDKAHSSKRIKSSNSKTYKIEEDEQQNNDSDDKENGQFKTTFNCKLEYLINGKTIWNSFPPKKLGANLLYYLKRKDMNQSQRKECDILDDFMETLIVKLYKIKTRTKAIFKTPDGYSLRRYCYICCSGWLLNINIENGEGELMCNKKCEHYLSEEETSKLI